MVEKTEYFRHKAEQCRRWADAVANQDDPVVTNLLVLTDEFEARALALAAEEARAKDSEIALPL